MTNKLVELDIRETSGVDHPAHLEEGWLVMKSAGVDVAAEVERVLKEAETLEKQHRILVEALEGSVQYLDQAPDTVKAAANVLHEFLMSPEMDHEEDASEAPAEETTQKDAGDADDAVRRSLAERVVAGIAALFTKSASANTEEETVAEEKTEAVEETTEAAATEETTEETATEEAAATEETTEAADTSVTDAIAETFRTELAKAREDILAEVKAEFEKRDEDAETSREALSKALDRVEKLEGRTATRQSIDGQDELEKSADEGKSVWNGTFRSRMAR